ncbi:Ribonuclease P protein component [Oceanicola granulosus HTCC2516]|uniref:Ribonuclease P protein component n=1 Tax=Oceanicola granulosus (strain ATCC BAA-861 / DSM 15982 / KCTC 12143 / HTCC2516) TaxID=314256 RepID=Q2CI06_OCEGH|nr:ribonuclease P protein component [Oceanicola granulosus]EAR52452.1 Ribonuclease P protein component [Oceanicola granulosus HTCC2516]
MSDTPEDTAEAPPAAVSSCPAIERLRERADFLAAARGRSKGTAGFHLQARRRPGGEGPARVGFTCSKKVGNAVARNRAKRRLREIARLELPAHGRPGWDYVLIGRRTATDVTPFAQMRADLAAALAEVHR